MKMLVIKISMISLIKELFVCLSIFVFHCLEYARVWAFSGLCIPVYKDRILDSVIRENMGQGRPLLWHILCRCVVKAHLFKKVSPFLLILLSKIFLLHKLREQARTSLTTPQVHQHLAYFY